MLLSIRDFQEADYPEVSKIYKDGIDTGIATFETEVPDFKNWNLRFYQSCRLVAILDSEVVGWAALSLVSKRNVYSGVAEVTIYVSQKHQGQKIGSLLMKKLIAKSEEEGFWTLTAHIFPQNKSSIHLHLKYDFKVLGVHEKIAKRDNKWEDNILLERRSTKIF
ncbi:phosphinothricin acetyltransferase [Leeuwenhoekiella aestuarii]|uniref:Phosphinothricin acetyltransferase n=1 Tax=Leeuwenhoekiella aestuarii TaxID=2249426 RepID=A0A4Q0NU74_9FLAO|nr:GNAT family N-acetyltransferase [Leeuwenhoekiella aestuarii]RXG14310.1 phosphinothricin acetyltransferase [Leeuwenhoekiella aestuarii]RXG19059.1 phosphinothricin acetyltransferase [Leeuwenhoekiella aestuarii]